MSKARDELQKEITRLIDVYWGISGHNLEEKRPLYTEAILSQVDTYVKEHEESYDDIFKWLLGQNGDFPTSEPGKRYNWRPELRDRLDRLQAKRGKT